MSTALKNTLLILLIFKNLSLSALSSQVLLDHFPTDINDSAYSQRAKERWDEYMEIKNDSFPQSKIQRLKIICIEGPIYSFLDSYLTQNKDKLNEWFKILKSNPHISQSSYNLYLLHKLYRWLGNNHEKKKLEKKVQQISNTQKNAIQGFIKYLQETDQKVIQPFKKKREELRRLQEMLNNKTTRTCENLLRITILYIKTGEKPHKEIEGYLQEAIDKKALLSKEERKVLFSQMQEYSIQQNSYDIFCEDFVNDFLDQGYT